MRLHRMIALAVIWTGLQICGASISPGEGFKPEFQGPSQRYQLAIARLIYRQMEHKRYCAPVGGVATVAFTVGRNGTVIVSSIEKTSGLPNIDSLAMAAVPVGYNFPPFPPDLKVAKLNVQVPLRFEARPCVSGEAHPERRPVVISSMDARTSARSSTPTIPDHRRSNSMVWSAPPGEGSEKAEIGIPSASANLPSIGPDAIGVPGRFSLDPMPEQTLGNPTDGIASHLRRGAFFPAMSSMIRIYQ